MVFKLFFVNWLICLRSAAIIYIILLRLTSAASKVRDLDLFTFFTYLTSICILCPILYLGNIHNINYVRCCNNVNSTTSIRSIWLTEQHNNCRNDVERIRWRWSVVAELPNTGKWISSGSLSSSSSSSTEFDITLCLSVKLTLKMVSATPPGDDTIK